MLEKNSSIIDGKDFDDAKFPIGAVLTFTTNYKEEVCIVVDYRYVTGKSWDGEEYTSREYYLYCFQLQCLIHIDEYYADRHCEML